MSLAFEALIIQTCAALLMAGCALANTGLMAWLWRFPMLPDAATGNPHGRSSAPAFWLAAHRWIGYLFALCYLILLAIMLPRLLSYQTFSTISMLHLAIGMAIGPVLLFKIYVIRYRQRSSHWLPVLGSALLILALSAAALGFIPLARVLHANERLSSSAQAGKIIFMARCLQCHGASLVAAETFRSDKWHRVIRKMRRRALRSAAIDISQQERHDIAAFLIESRGWQKR
jgi:mono/diheme cytochrome c family protein